MPSTANLRRITQHNLQTFRDAPLSELSGSLGDLGTLLPLLVALTLSHSISLPATLLFTGASNILTGALFGIPLPVQPMKAIASIAIARSYSLHETAAAGIGVAAVVGIMSVTGLLSWVTRVVPIPVVKGIQVGAGLSLVLSAGEKMLRPLGWTGPSPVDNLLWAIGAALALLACTRAPRVPYALLIFILGLIFAGIKAHDTHLDGSSIIPTIPIVVPSWATFGRTFVTASLGQLPLTTLNSIIAVTHLAADLLPSVPTPTVTAIGSSVAVMNLIGCWFGAMPACHGSGGLAAQHRFGARSGASVIILGVIKMILGLVGGESLVRLLASFPKALLGVMVLAAGVELAKVGESLNAGARDLWEEAEMEASGGPMLGKKLREPDEAERRDRWAVMMVTVAGLLAFRNDAVGFVAGMLWHWGLKVQLPTLQRPNWWQRMRTRRERSAAGEEGESLL
ncbi:putative sulfate transporter [Neofusicoccum parvum]|nr:putative sulfate transporter [Neofusicoccum parvum]